MSRPKKAVKKAAKKAINESAGHEYDKHRQANGLRLLRITVTPWTVYTSQVLSGGAGPFLEPTPAAVTMGIVGVTFFDRRFGKNQSFNSAGLVWGADVPKPREGTHPHKVNFKNADSKVASDDIGLAVIQSTELKSEERDQDDALGARPEHGLLGTRLERNKNGKKWS